MTRFYFHLRLRVANGLLLERAGWYVLSSYVPVSHGWLASNHLLWHPASPRPPYGVCLPWPLAAFQQAPTNPIESSMNHFCGQNDRFYILQNALGSEVTDELSDPSVVLGQDNNSSSNDSPLQTTCSMSTPAHWASMMSTGTTLSSGNHTWSDLQSNVNRAVEQPQVASIFPEFQTIGTAPTTAQSYCLPEEQLLVPQRVEHVSIPEVTSAPYNYSPLTVVQHQSSAPGVLAYQGWPMVQSPTADEHGTSADHNTLHASSSARLCEWIDDSGSIISALRRLLCAGGMAASRT
ncbi:hypothetical protein F5I97DRAFT_235046 [Phlebopus sp. FC_14]|nr:hypothetical protein F5I97DRAFT_235046 [Phlebopus sp. FC_14]